MWERLRWMRMEYAVWVIEQDNREGLVGTILMSVAG